MISEEKLIALIDLIYEAALDNDLWPRVLRKIADAAGTVQAGMASADRNADIVTAIAPRCDPNLLTLWREYWAVRDPFFSRAILRPAGEIYTLDEIISREEFAATAVFREVWQRANCSLATAASNLVAEENFSALIGISNTPGQDFLSQEQLRLFKIITRHVGRSVRVSRELWKLDLTNLVADEQFEVLPDGAMLVDAFCRVVLANAAAAQMLDAGDGMTIHNGRVTIPNAQDALQRLVASCARAAPDLDGPGGELDVARNLPLSPIKMTVAPLRSRIELPDIPWTNVGPPVAIVMIADPDLDRQRRTEKLRRLFGLTNAEATLAVEIMKGDGRRAAAQRCGITDGTAKTHLAHIFEKTRTRRQAELIRLLLSAAKAPGGRR
ncbi:MAG TPA: helix-turn-helix transcriptional regulator [Methylocella sp.]|nr:helix-turn-helix transcriptional regulator [Methylocella sp.]